MSEVINQYDSICLNYRQIKGSTDGGLYDNLHAHSEWPRWPYQEEGLIPQVI